MKRVLVSIAYGVAAFIVCLILWKFCFQNENFLEYAALMGIGNGFGFFTGSTFKNCKDLE
ncbi:MAG: hypothetical protein Q4D02_02190 [Clostridia bacterium]|nr:hypothetical protein [Clostridia bacterium]